MTLGELFDGLRRPVTLPSDAAAIAVTSLSADSRTVASGALFFALPGAKTDGAKHVDEAVARGAAAVVTREPVADVTGAAAIVAPEIHDVMSEVAARFHRRPTASLALVGVTGTNGKTTVTHLVESIWRAAGFRPGVIGTIEYRFGDRRWPAPFTTPQAIELQALLAEMRELGATHVVMEVSSHSLALGRVRDCDWSGAAFTNLTRDHLDFHPDMESYFEAKGRLFLELLPASQRKDRFAVINRDDPYGRRLLEAIEDRVVTWGRGEDADVAPIGVERSLAGLRGELRIGGRSVQFSSKLVGDAHLDNILTAAAIAVAEGIADDVIADGIARCEHVPGRMERVDGGALFAVLVDYAHTPDALERALRVCRNLCSARLIVVFGCGGGRDRGKRPIMGEIAGRLADLAILTSDNPRSEDPFRILHEIESGVREAGLEPIAEARVRKGEDGGFVVVEDRHRAIRLAVESARSEDVVLIAGKGHEPYQLVGAERRDFDDKIEAQKALAELAA
ncbi:MAG: UDP-N-acetylmuramoyl-L-alanyl-D-glutamate--2,6-diaminopimelate ligase [Candidatus Binatia bacterium]